VNQGVVNLANQHVTKHEFSCNEKKPRLQPVHRFSEAIRCMSGHGKPGPLNGLTRILDAEVGLGLPITSNVLFYYSLLSEISIGKSPTLIFNWREYKIGSIGSI
jgi:hypothetical protein